MPWSVLRNFNTTTQRFRKDDVIQSGADLSPHTVQTAVASGLIEFKPEEDDASQDAATN